MRNMVVNVADTSRCDGDSYVDQIRVVRYRVIRDLMMMSMSMIMMMTNMILMMMTTMTTILTEGTYANLFN